MVPFALTGSSDTLAKAVPVAADVFNEVTLTSDSVKESLSSRFRSDTLVIHLVELFKNVEACANAGALTIDDALVSDGAFTIDVAFVSGVALTNDNALVSGATAALSIISMA